MYFIRYSLNVSGLQTTLSGCMIVGALPQMELVHLFTNLRATKLLFFAFRFQHLLLCFFLKSYYLYLIKLTDNHLLNQSIQWSPDKASVFGSSAEDGLLNIWDYDRVCT